MLVDMVSNLFARVSAKGLHAINIPDKLLAQYSVSNTSTYYREIGSFTVIGVYQGGLR